MSCGEAWISSVKIWWETIYFIVGLKYSLKAAVGKMDLFMGLLRGNFQHLCWREKLMWPYSKRSLKLGESLGTYITSRETLVPNFTECQTICGHQLHPLNVKSCHLVLREKIRAKMNWPFLLIKGWDKVEQSMGGASFEFSKALGGGALYAKGGGH